MADYPAGTALVERILGLDSAELVQAGGQAAVYKVQAGQEIFALKLIEVAAENQNPEEEDTDVSAVVSRAQREVAILEQVNVQVLAKRGPLGLTPLDINGGRWLYFTEEWIEGTNLRDIIAQQRLSAEQVARLGVDLIQAVSWLSDHGLVHRDIKPANVMWATDRSRFVLLDPGIALDLAAPSLTRTAAIVGTLAYFSPEQMDVTRKRSLDFRSDLFAIGIVMYEAAMKEHPFAAGSASLSDVLAAILIRSPQPIADRLESFPKALSNIITRLLGKEPHLRFRSCGRARQAIEQIAASLGVEA